MTGPLIPLPLPDLTGLVQPVATVFAAYGAAKIGPPLVRNARQRAYDEASAAEVVAPSSSRRLSGSRPILNCRSS